MGTGPAILIGHLMRGYCPRVSGKEQSSPLSFVISRALSGSNQNMAYLPPKAQTSD